MTPTADQVRRAWSRLPRQYGAHVLDKHRGLGAAAAEVAAFAVVTLGVMPREEFIERHAQSLGPCILIPFVPGQPHPWFDFTGQLATLAHELQHVVQWGAAKVGFPAEYAASSRSRARFEVDAMKPALLLRHQLAPLVGTAEEVAARYAAKLEGYACDASDIALAASLLEPFVTSVMAGATTSRAYPQVAEILDALGEP